LIANSHETKRTMLNHFGKHIAEEKIAVIYHGIDEKLLNAEGPHLPEVKQKSKGTILGNAGRLTEQKGQKHLIELAKNLKEKGLEFTLFIAGTGELQEELITLITDYNLEEEVILLGFVADMEAFMRSIDIFVLSSSWEGFGFVIVEAMAKGKPVVAFDITSNPEIIADGKTGLLAKHLETKKLANQTARLISGTTLREQMGQAAKQSVVDRFLIKERITELEAYLLKG
ncbi:glycosyltransferase family 4 protein, partial [Bacteroidia bacterium]|nr:glycosyltransferase family 4 protein [Bacteroidia bacterium]